MTSDQKKIEQLIEDMLKELSTWKPASREAKEIAIFQLDLNLDVAAITSPSTSKFRDSIGLAS